MPMNLDDIDPRVIEYIKKREEERTKAGKGLLAERAGLDFVESISDIGAGTIGGKTPEPMKIPERDLKFGMGRLSRQQELDDRLLKYLQAKEARKEGADLQRERMNIPSMQKAVGEVEGKSRLGAFDPRTGEYTFSRVEAGERDQPPGLGERMALQDLYRQKAETRAEARAAKKEKDKPAKENQFKAANFGKRMEQAEAIMSKLVGVGFDRTEYLDSAKNYLLGAVGLEGVQDKDYREQAQAERNFINATLRRESGAAIAPHEYDNAERQYFPRPGDNDSILRNKKANRQQVINAMRAEAGKAWGQVEYVDPIEGDQKSLQQRAAEILRKRGK